MKILKIIALLLAVVVVIVQFIRPEKNTASPQGTSNDISASFNVPGEIATTLRTSCYDCHSNETRYPWYAEVQPVGWWLNDHITEAKGHLNFSEFGKYRLRRQYHKFEEIAEQLQADLMPLPSYLILHGGAKLSPEAKQQLLAWAEAMRTDMKMRYPIDSLERR